MNCEKHIDRLTDIIKEIDYTKSTILTGSNASGKSLIRKQIGFQLEEILGRKPKIKSSSMERRTTNNSSWGALSSAMLDTAWLATSYNSIKMIKDLINVQDDADYLVFDEPEIGCSAEVQLGICKYINENVTKPFMVITHSDYIINNLEYDEFINIDGYTKNEYLNRDVEIITLEMLEEKQNKLFSYIQKLNKK